MPLARGGSQLPIVAESAGGGLPGASRSTGQRFANEVLDLRILLASVARPGAQMSPRVHLVSSLHSLVIQMHVFMLRWFALHSRQLEWWNWETKIYESADI